jgi:hypothetical protein
MPWYIELYENKEQLCRREVEIIRLMGTLNSEIAGRTRKEWGKENWIEHKELLSARNKENYENHREEILEAKRPYNINNTKARKEYMKKYQQKNKEHINMKNRENYVERQAKKKNIEALNPVILLNYLFLYLLYIEL